MIQDIALGLLLALPGCLLISYIAYRLENW